MAARLRLGLSVLVVCWVVLFWRLGHVSLMDDEAHYATLTKEMAAHGDWLVPRLAGVAFIDKPVFFHWVQGATTRLSTDPELAVRLPSALAALALLATVGVVGRVWGGPGLAGGAWLMLATMPATFLLGRSGYMDMLFTALLFGAVALLTLVMSGSSKRMQIGAAICLVLAVLTKGPVALGLVVGWLALLWLSGAHARRAVSRLNLPALLAAVCVLASPWFVWMYVQFGDRFIEGYLGQGHAGYFTPRASASSSQWTFYLRNFTTSLFPWSVIAIGYGIDSVRRWRQGARPEVWEVAMWIWVAVVLLAFTVVPFRVDRYIYPVAPACALLAARGWLLASSTARWHESIGTFVAAVVMVVAFIASGGSLWAALPGLGMPLPATVDVFPLLMIVGGLAFIVALLRNRAHLPALAGWPIATMLAIYACLVYFGLPVLRAGLPVKQVGQFIVKDAAGDAPVGVVGLDRWQQSLTYYLRTPPERLRNAEDVQRFTTTPGPRWVVMRKGAPASSAVGGCVTYSVPAIVGTEGRGIRRQVWDDVLVVSMNGTSAYAGCPEPGTLTPR